MKVKVDTTKMSYKEIDSLVQELGKIRMRKGELSSCLNVFRSMISKMRNKNRVSLVNKHTGEVLNPNDWELYDETTHSFYVEQEDE